MIQRRKLTTSARRVTLVEDPPTPTTEETRKLPGPDPSYVTSERMRHQVMAMSAAGLSIPNIAYALEVTEELLRQHCAQELAEGTALCTGKASGRMFELLLKGEGKVSVDAGKFWLTHKGGWKPTQTIEHVGANGEPISISSEIRSLTNEERVIRLLQLLNTAAARGA